jgi:fibronectin-binding autotransporter adhesin
MAAQMLDRAVSRSSQTSSKKQNTKSIRMGSIRMGAFGGAVVLAAIVPVHQAMGANSTWLGTTDNNWATTTNWTNNTPAGNATNTGSNDIATFNVPLNGTFGGALSPIALDATTRSVGTINFDTSAGAFVIGINTVTLRLQGLLNDTSNFVGMTSTVVNPEVIAANLVFSNGSGSNNPTYIFRNSAASTTATLSLTGAMTAAASSTRPTIIQLDGSNTGNNIISGNITNNTANQNTAMLVKTGVGTWILTGSNSFSASSKTPNANQGIQINQGKLSAQSVNALGTGSNSVANQTSANSGATLEVAGGITLGSSSNIINLTNVLGAGTAAGTGGTFVSTGTNTYQGIIQVGTTAGVSATLATANAADVFTINAVNNGAADSVLNYSGPGTLLLNSAGNYIGTWSFNNGVAQLNNNNALGGNAVGINFGAGTTGKLQLNSFSPTVGSLNNNANVGAATIENGSGGLSTLTVNTTGSSIFGGVLQDGTGGGNLGLAKNGLGSLTLTRNNTYTGNTALNGGSLTITNASGSALGTGNMTAAANATFAGTGTMSGNATISNGAFISPGTTGVGTLTVGSLNLGATSMLNYDINSTTSLDTTNVTQTDGLSIDGGTFNINGGLAPFTFNGVYNLIGFAGNIGGAGGVSSLKINAGNESSTKTYTFGTGSGFVTLTVADSGNLPAFWNVDADGNWGTGTNWTAGTPNSTGAFAGFGAGGATITAPRTVTVDGAFIAGTLSFNSANAFTVAGGTLTLDNGSANAFITDAGGSHTVTSALNLTSSGALVNVINAGDIMTLSGTISGAGASIDKKGNGALVLTGNNSYTGGTQIDGGVIGINSGTSLGDPAGALTFNGGSIQLLADVSSTRNYQVNALKDAIVDTNGHGLTLAGNITPLSGALGGFVKNGAGALVLQGTNSYVGPTTINSGSLSISSNANLGDPATGATLILGSNTSLLIATTMSLNNGAVGTNDRAIAIGAAGASVDIAPTTTLTISGPVTGGAVTLTDAGTLSLFSTASTSAFVVPAGAILQGSNSTAFSNAGFGTGQITLQGGTLATGGTGNALNVANALVVPAGQTGTITMPNSFTLQGAVTGGGTLNLNVNTTNAHDILSNNWTAFTGLVNIFGSGTLQWKINGGGFGAGFTQSTLDLGGSVTIQVLTNSPPGNTVNIGALSGEVTTASLGAGSAGPVTYNIGALNSNTTYMGTIGSNTNLTKVGTGSLTLATAATISGNTTVNQGTLTALAALTTGPVTVNPTGTTGTANDAATLNSNGSIGGGAVTVNSSTTVATAIGTLNESSAAPTWGGLSGNGHVNFTNAAGPVALALNPSTNLTFSGVLADAAGGALSLSKGGAGTQALSGNNTYTGGTTMTGGVLQLGSPRALGAGGLRIDGGNITTTAGFTNAIQIPSLTVNGGNIDLNNNDLILPYTTSSPISTVQGMLAIGYANGAWNATAGVTSMTSVAAAADVSKLTALGYGEAADLGITSDDGVSITGPAVVVRYTYYGDSSLDGKIDLGNDFNLFLQGFLNPQLVTPANAWELGDYNYSGTVTMADFQLFVDGFKGQSGSSLGALDSVIESSALLSTVQKESLLSVVPEPASLGLLAAASCIFAARRRRRQ